MIMDATQRGWAMSSLGIFLVGGVAYAIYAANAPVGPCGDSTIGLIFGTVGFAFMIFSALLGARKRVPTWRLGRAQAWMRGHLWLGLLSLPLILFHAGFQLGGTLTRVLLGLLIITVVSGLFGAALQHYVPRMMTTDVPLETIYDEIGNVRNSLREEADRAVESLCGSMALTNRVSKEAERAGGFSALRPIAVASAPLRTSAAISAGASAAVAAAPERILLTVEESAPLKSFYLSELRLFLEDPNRRGQRLGDAARARSAFAALQTRLPLAAQTTLKDLEEICDESRQFVRQERLHRWLHGWLLVHIPISLALMVLGAIHAVMALRY